MNIDDETLVNNKRGRLVIKYESNSLYIPIEQIRDITSGKKPISWLPDAVWRKILKEWLETTLTTGGSNL